jgi:hypothetical protein
MSTLSLLLYILALIHFAYCAQIYGDDILNGNNADEDDYDIPQWLVPQAPTVPDRRNNYQRVEVHSEQPRLEEKSPPVTVKIFCGQIIITFLEYASFFQPTNCK